MRTLRTSPKVIALALAAAAVVTVVAAAGSPASAARRAPSPSPCGWANSPTSPTPQALVGTEGGIFAKQLGSGVDRA